METQETDIFSCLKKDAYENRDTTEAAKLIPRAKRRKNVDTDCVKKMLEPFSISTPINIDSAPGAPPILSPINTREKNKSGQTIKRHRKNVVCSQRSSCAFSCVIR